LTRKILANKPLLEAIFELRWELPEIARGIRKDKHYPILIGSMYEKIKMEYPFHEELPTATMPDEMAEYIVQHRFRKADNEWPLVQIGPGIITLNDTEKYVWEDFEKRIPQVVHAFFDAYSVPSELKINNLLLRYIDAVAFDYQRDNVFDFLQNKLKIGITIPPNLFENTGVDKLPLNFDLRFSFPSSNPTGEMYAKFARGKKGSEDALIWETQIRCEGANVPRNEKEIMGWVEVAHQLTDDWFFKLIEGDLLRRFE